MPLPNLKCSCEEFCLHCLWSDYRPLRKRKEYGEIAVGNWTIKPKIKKKKSREINIGVVAIRYSLLVTQPVSNCERQDLYWVHQRFSPGVVEISISSV